MSTNTSRRSLITTAAVAALAPAIPAASAALPVVPLARPETIPEDWVARLKPEFDRALKLWLRLYALNHDDLWNLDGDLPHLTT
jgi:hypothetical protein